MAVGSGQWCNLLDWDLEAGVPAGSSRLDVPCDNGTFSPFSAVKLANLWGPFVAT